MNESGRALKTAPGVMARFLATINDRFAEWFSSAAMIAWGLALAMPGDTLTGAAFAAFQRFGMTEGAWAAAFLGVGLARMVVLYVNGKWPKGPYIRMAGSLFGAVSWAQVAVLFLLATYMVNGVMPTGPGIYALLAASDLLSIFRAAFDVRYRDQHS